MNLRRIFLVILTAASLAGVATFASKPNSYPDIPVTTVLNITGSIMPDPGTNYRVEGDGIGSYNDGVASVSSILQGGLNSATRDWVLDTRSSTTRTALIDMRTPVPNSGAVPVFRWEYLPTRIIVKCHEAISGSFPAIQLNQTVACPDFVRFVFAGNDYRYVMSSGPGASVNYPETNNALVTCTAVDASKACNAWTVRPITQSDGTVQNVARLERLGHKGATLGDFYVTFSFEITNP